jgi:hypothetical protein
MLNQAKPALMIGGSALCGAIAGMVSVKREAYGALMLSVR